MHDPRFDPLPEYPIQRIERLTRDLAWGVYYKKWDADFNFQLEYGSGYFFDGYTISKELRHYIEEVWGPEHPSLSLLIKFNFMDQVEALGGDTYKFELTEKAFRLLEAPSTASVFISYRRHQSSALALLLVARMKEHNLSPFLDMHPDIDDDGNHLPPGSVWKQELTKAINEREYFIILVGPETFQGETFVIHELRHAIEAGKKIIPIWHNGFDIERHLPNELIDVKDVIDQRSAIIVEKENPQQYTSAIQTLLSVFGITP